MRLPRFFSPDITQNLITLDEVESHHLRVLRIRERSQDIEVFDGFGNHRICSVVKIKGKSVIVAPVEPVQSDKVLVPQITLAVSMPKGERQNVIIQMCQELGLTKLIPIVCSRSVRGENMSKSKMERWRRVAISACKQSGVNYITQLSLPTNFSQVIGLSKENSLSLIFAPYNGEPISKLLQNFPSPSNVILLIGPEGGFTDRELEQATGAGFEVVSIPVPILRIETASVAAVAIIRSLCAK